MTRPASVRRPRLSFVGQIFLLQTGVLVFALVLAFAVVAWLLEQEMSGQYERRALAVARTVAADPEVLRAAEAGTADPLLRERVERIRRANDALFVVVADRHGIRLTHPNPDRIGEPLSTDATDVLNGTETTNVEEGTLGLSARGKSPIRDEAGQVVGVVSVGFDANGIRRSIAGSMLLLLEWAGVVLLVGVAGSMLLARRLGRLTLGLEPDQMAELVREREAILHGIREGVLAVDVTGRITLCNDEARRLLQTTIVPGAPVSSVSLPPRLEAEVLLGRAVSDLVTICGDRLLVANYRAVVHQGRSLGGVLTIRDRTELDSLERELDAVKAVTNALRAQRHEFANRIHTVAGLLQTEHYGEAAAYLDAVSAEMATGIDPMCNTVRDPYLQAFLAVKVAEAAERGVTVRVDAECAVPGRLDHPVPVTTVVGNIVDNATEAALRGSRRPAQVEVSFVADGDALIVQVSDSGDGIAPDVVPRLFLEGASTRGEGRGLGLALAQHAAHRLGGHIRLTSPGGDQHGAIFTALLPSVIEYDAVASVP